MAPMSMCRPWYWQLHHYCACSKELEYTELKQRLREQLEEKDTKLAASTQQAQQQVDVLRDKLDQVGSLLSWWWCRIVSCIQLVVKKRDEVEGWTWHTGTGCVNSIVWCWWERQQCRSHSHWIAAKTTQCHVWPGTTSTVARPAGNHGDELYGLITHAICNR